MVAKDDSVLGCFWPRKQPQGIQSRKRAAQKRGRLQGQPATKRTERNRLRPSTVNETPSRQSRGRKRKQSIKDALEPNPDPSHKRQRTSPTRPAETTFGESAIGTGAPQQTDPISFWVEEGRWPEEQCWPEETSETVPTMERLLARKKSSSNLSRKRSNSAASTTPSDQKPREEKTAPYRDPRYKTLLETKGSFMGKSDLGITEESKNLCRRLLETAQVEPQDSLFRSDIFESTCRKVEDRNEARVIRDITPLIVPSAEILCTYGADHLKHLIESVNAGWNNSIPFTGTRPQPDYSVGFRREAFTDDRLAKLSPFIGDFIFGDQSFFMATYYMYFPFLTCEVKCGAAALDIADRQNAHSMTLAVRAIVELFRALKREGEVHQQILAFSISHDHSSVRIYGHYPVIAGKDTKYYRHPIHKFDFTALDGRDKWTAYRFTKNVYDIWMPAHFKKVCSAIDQLPSNLDFDVPPLSEATGLSQDLGNLMQANAGSISVPIEQDSQPSNAKPQGVTPDTSFTGPGPVKRRKG
ncbi:hypothetical protein B0T25DRAFT_520339 [Lasiosphaeria hispida]|uniref:DUF7924 domain-containing protein n=1 Tax=Lasiosphaeria hispida TaxID=260671 RepID=A0AAJ0HGV4_9PEZI|nr:hypothetical protein B0T25DRAFT_520339 [Lasiosphaeria hispida]